jgi:hypothetical protein
MRKMDRVEYYEKVIAGKLIVAGIIIVSIIGAITVLTVRYSISIGTPLFAVVMALPFIVAFLLLTSFLSMKISITSKELTVNYGFFHKHLLLHEIESCEQVKTEFREYSGLGVRIGGDKSHAYLTFFGKAVRINIAGKNAFVFSTNQPEKICRIISTKNQQTEP